MDSITRISDLPDLSSGGGGGSGGIPGFSDMSPSNGQPPSYMPMNIHQNPYGNHPPTTVFPPPQQTQAPPKLNSNTFVFPGENSEQMMRGQPPPSMPPQLSHHQIQQHQHPQQSQMFPQTHPNQFAPSQPNYPLPSRDIPQDMSVLTMDERIQPNYIPPPHKKDYIYEDEEREEEKWRVQKKKEKRVRFVDDAFVEIQKPVIITLLFLFFQLPFLNSFLLKYLFFLKLFGEDGNMNMWGYVLKSVLFGSLVYGLDYLMLQLS